MSNGDAEPLPDDGGPDRIETPAPGTKTRPRKTATKKRPARTAAAGPSPFAKRASVKRSKRTISGYRRVLVGQSDMFVTREVADALTDKDLKRLRAVFKRARKRARKGDTKPNH